MRVGTSELLIIIIAAIAFTVQIYILYLLIRLLKAAIRKLEEHDK